RAGERSVAATDRSEPRAVAESRALFRRGGADDAAHSGGSRAQPRGREARGRSHAAVYRQGGGRFEPGEHRSDRAGCGARQARRARSAAEPYRRTSLLRRAFDRGDGRSGWSLAGDGQARVGRGQGLAVPRTDQKKPAPGLSRRRAASRVTRRRFVMVNWTAVTVEIVVPALITAAMGVHFARRTNHWRAGLLYFTGWFMAVEATLHLIGVTLLR